VVNVEKGQFLAPWDMSQVVSKLTESGLEASSGRLWLTERGSSFGYNTLALDYRSLPQLQALGCPVIFDATHAVQQPGGRGSSSGRQWEFVAPLARAARWLLMWQVCSWRCTPIPRMPLAMDQKWCPCTGWRPFSANW
jgi:2-dehydro-3-deoxyphosphooctonate aldolase (KDO 8-P synthase)